MDIEKDFNRSSLKLSQELIQGYERVHLNGESLDNICKDFVQAEEEVTNFQSRIHATGIATSLLISIVLVSVVVGASWTFTHRAVLGLALIALLLFLAVGDILLQRKRNSVRAAQKERKKILGNFIGAVEKLNLYNLNHIIPDFVRATGVYLARQALELQEQKLSTPTDTPRFKFVTHDEAEVDYNLDRFLNVASEFGLTLDKRTLFQVARKQQEARRK